MWDGTSNMPWENRWMVAAVLEKRWNQILCVRSGNEPKLLGNLFINV